MEQWRIESPRSLDVDGVRRLEVRLVGGRIDVVGGADRDVPQDAGAGPWFVPQEAPSGVQDTVQETVRDEVQDDVPDLQDTVQDTPTDAPPAGAPQDGAPEATGTAHIEVSRVDGPLLVSLVDGTLLITHEVLTWAGIFERFNGYRSSAVVSVSIPQHCPVRLGVVTAEAVVSGIVADTTAVRSVSGDITLDGVRSGVTARTVSGDLESRHLAGDLEFTTISGELNVVQGSTGRLRAQTVSGDLNLDLDVVDGGTLDVKTVSGDLTLRLPRGVGLDVDVTTTSGSLDSGFDAVTSTRKPGQAAMSGRIGTGTAALHVRSVSGDVTLLAKAAS
jgi:hypothetical protein